MPRVSQQSCEALEATSNRSASNVKEKSAIKNEVENPVEQQVLHRKSERRRVARDIFLVFEEQRSNRRARGTSNKRQPRPKSKFGHLNVEDPNKSKGLLRDIKNEPKCYFSPACQQKQKAKLETPAVNATKSKNEHSATAVNTSESTDSSARVNPIFLWVKQDDTRIVEVRCEDYDKRNRIRITKTTNGWRAIPRTDPSSSRIVKFFQTPLLKVKREVYVNQIHEKCNNVSSTNMEHQLQPDKDATVSIKSVGKTENTMLESPAAVCNTLRQASKNKKGKRCRKTRVKVKEKAKEKYAINPTKYCHSVENTVEELNQLDNLQNKEQLTMLTRNTKVPHLVEVIGEFNNEDSNTTINTFNDNEKRDVDTDTYQNLDTHTPELQLCPKTGLFLPSLVNNFDLVNCSTIPLAKDILVDLVDCEIEYQKRQELTLQNIDVEAKNLKELLDEADLLQHCEDNANSDAELVDSLVKRSCEDNLIQENDILKDSVDISERYVVVNESDLTPKELVIDGISQMPDAVSESPKCLSFNEAGEIEGLNGELFQSNNYSDTFVKDHIVEIELSSKTSLDSIEVSNLNTSPVLTEGITEITEDAPKDLSYKKREEVCPPSESRSQCAVTSSSDVIKSPVQDGIPAIESTSETIKNLILEQFMKLNTLNISSASTGKAQQSEPIDLGKNRELVASNDLTSNYGATSNYIETVVIDDNSDDEPVKKRLRKTVNNVSIEETQSVSIIDKDPDPLTQLQLLIRNTQWKVPDPILVPKDRLGAVLASPAREIPLLITTRPELRLPEAFAHPEIIQNPNILVISMAQLEAILKNELELEKNESHKPLHSLGNEFLTKPSRKQHDCESNNESKVRQSESIETNRKCAHVESSLASDINAATLAVLNQMLWLPYFGQLSQEFFKSLKDSTNSQNKYPSSILPLYNPQFGLQHLDGLYKNYVKQLSQLKNLSMETDNNQTQVYPNSVGSLQNPVELAIFQKIIEHQMNSFLNMTRYPIDTGQREPSIVKHSSDEHSSNAILNSNTDSIEPKRLRKSQGKPNSLSFEIPDHNSNIELPDKSLCLQNVKDTIGCENTKTENLDLNKFSGMQKQVPENKPRLTCKSLSNLLEPESVPSAEVQVPLVNLTSDVIKSQHKYGGKQTDINAKSISKESRCLQGSETSATLKVSRTDKVNPMLSTIDVSTQRKRNFNFVESGTTETTSRNSDTLPASDTNPALWHPLFGSNTKTGYSSPWQWTTVTATGE